MADTPNEDAAPMLVERPKTEIKEEYEKKLKTLVESADLQYSLKRYNEASELYSQASELQSELNGELDPKNADILYLYGRALFKVALLQSDVLGGQVTAEKAKKDVAKEKAVPEKEKRLAGEIMEAIVEEKAEASSSSKNKENTKDGLANKPFFEITGDDNWDTDSDDDEDAEAQVDAAIEEEDDFATAYEILDLARVCLEKQAEEIADKDPSKLRSIQEKLADTYDLQAEISLENEKFLEAVGDTKKCAALKDELYPQTSQLVAEAHYKVSLALEFASVSAFREAQAKEESGFKQPAEKPEVDEKMRAEAAEETAIAVSSCKGRLATEKEKLKGLEGAAKTKQETEIKDVEDIIEEMEARLTDLRGPVITVSGGPTGSAENDPMAGMLAQMLGQSPAEQKAILEEAKENANDLSGLVRKKKPAASKPAADTNGSSSGGNGKRKAEEDSDGESKKTRVE
ncbi:putative tetratricopeptide repeat domain protein [Venturia nashicola]|nr:putative tetratricopeptide repeat domain protein [Venturia nashicola]